MGLDLDVLLLVGVDYDEIVEEVVEYTTVTKYNQDTGVPFEVKQKKSSYKVGKNIYEDKYEAKDTIERIGLCIYGDYDSGELIGLSLDRNEGSRIATGFGGCVGVDDIEKAIETVTELLSSLGVENPIVSVRTYSTASW